MGSLYTRLGGKNKSGGVIKRFLYGVYPVVTLLRDEDSLPRSELCSTTGVALASKEVYYGATSSHVIGTSRRESGMEKSRRGL